jgi:DNA-directed RNA polymerase specialized sigma24 family protein
MNTLSDSSILILIQMGDRLGIKQLYDKYKNKLLMNISRMLPGINREVADELILHALIKTWIHRNDLPAAENFFAWLISGIQEEIDALLHETWKVNFISQ